jgi:hypothetical protein
MSQFTLDAITLEGIGSYISRTRLELRPLTVLCGKNGAGKSTWLKAIRILKESLEANRLPYGFHQADWSQNNIQIMNAFYHLAATGDDQSIDFDSPNSSMPGSIEIEFHRNRTDKRFGYHELQSQGDGPIRLLDEERLAGTRYKVTIAHPTHHLDHENTPYLNHVIRLTINDKHIIELVGERDPHQRFEDGFTRPRRSKPYTLRCSSSWFPISTFPEGLVTIAAIQDLITLKLVGIDSKELSFFADKILLFLESRLKFFFSTLLDSFHIIDAIRLPQLALHTEDSKYDRSRSVGANGEKAWYHAVTKERYEMGKIQRIFFSELDSEILASALGCKEVRELFPKIDWIFSRFPPDQQIELERCYNSSGNKSYTEIALWFNDLLKDKGLWNQPLREITHQNHEPGPNYEHEFTEIENSQIRELIGDDYDELTDSDIIRLNFPGRLRHAG